MTERRINLDAVRDALGSALTPTAGDDADKTAAARATWSILVEPGDAIAGALIAAFGPVDALSLAQSDQAIAGFEAGVFAKARARWQPRLASVLAPMRVAERSGVRLLTPEDPAWPDGLRDLDVHAPVCLWVRGRADALNGSPAVAIVGARASTAYGEHVAAEIAAGCAVEGATIVSGAAYGIDGAAHRAALSAGGMTLALLAGGVERPYPAGHRDLIEKMASEGAVAAEVPCGQAPTKWRFLARNRLIAALGEATVIVEAGWRSGAINTAHHAATLGRALGVVPGPVTSASSAGCHRLLREADAVCVTGARDVLELLGHEDGMLRGLGMDDDARTDEDTRVLDALSRRTPRVPSEIAARAGLSIADTSALLGMMELRGVAHRTVEGWLVGVGGT